MAGARDDPGCGRDRGAHALDEQAPPLDDVSLVLLVQPNRLDQVHENDGATHPRAFRLWRVAELRHVEIDRGAVLPFWSKQCPSDKLSRVATPS